MSTLLAGTRAFAAALAAALLAVLPAALPAATLPAALPAASTPPPHSPLPAPRPLPEWRDMLRLELRLRDQPEAQAEIQKSFPDLAPAMARLGEAFARTAYPHAPALGRRNFAHLVRNLKMQNPAPADLRQFLHPNKKPWDNYTGPTDGNCHMLFNTGTLNLDKSDGSSKDHPARALAKKHLSFWTSKARVKKIAQALAATIRSTAADTAAISADITGTAGTAFTAALHSEWQRRHPKEKKLSSSEIRFALALLPYTA